MARIATCLDDYHVHSTAAHVVDRELGESGTYPSSLVGRVHTDDLDPAHALVERVQGYGDEANGAVVSHGDENVAFIIGATGSDRLGLVLAPVGMQTQEEVVTKNLTHGSEDWFPGAEGELDDCFEVMVLELPDLDRGVRHGLTLTRRRIPSTWRVCFSPSRAAELAIDRQRGGGLGAHAPRR